MEAVLEGSRLGVDSFMKELPELGREMDRERKSLKAPRERETSTHCRNGRSL